MMLLSRFWYVILSFCVGVAIYVVFVAVGQYNRRLQVAMTEGLASDSQVVRWSLQIEARRRLDALLVGSVDKGIQDSLVGANGKDKIPPKSKEEAKKSLDATLGKLPAEYKPDALFAVDRDGRVVAQIGFDQANTFDDFELGGYPAVYDALHGYLRDDTWVLGGRVYRVSARPVEYDVSQPPAGAIVGLRLVDNRFASDIAKLTRTNVAFYANGIRVGAAAGASDGFDEKMLDQVTAKLPELEADKTYKDSGRSGMRGLSDTTGAMYARFEGDAWEQRAGYAVARSRVSITGPMGFLSGADDKDKQTVPWLVLVTVVLLGIFVGIAFSLLEHTLPMNEMAKQAQGLKKGSFDLLQLARFRGGYRPIAQDLNQGIERVAEKGGGAPRKQADLESILGPVPAQPSMSAFSFPMAGDSQPGAPNPARVTGPGAFGPPPASGSRPGLAMPGGLGGAAGAAGMGGSRSSDARTTDSGQNGPPPPPNRPPLPGSSPGRPGLPPPAFPPREAPSKPNFLPGGSPPPPVAHQASAGSSGGFGQGLQQPITAPTAVNAPNPLARALQQDVPLSGSQAVPDLAGEEREEATRVHTGSAQQAAATDQSAEWLSVYEDFVRTKKQCGEPTEGLTFDKFQHTLKKNRDALIQRHGCKRVRFSVYVKEGRASLKATPVKE